MTQRGLRVLEADKTFFSKITNSITKLLIPTKVGINGLLISAKRNNVLKAYEKLIENLDNEIEKSQTMSKKLQDLMNDIVKKLEDGMLNGVGISSITLNDDYTLTITLTDDTSYTTKSIRGEKGEKGDKGDKGDNYTLTEADKQEIISEILESLSQEMQNKIAELQEEIQDLKKNTLKRTVEGESITINDSADMRFESVEISGNSEQETI